MVTKFGGKAGKGPQKKPPDFCGNPDHARYVSVSVSVTVRWDRGSGVMSRNTAAFVK